MKKITSICCFLTAVALAAFIAAGCAEQRKIIVKAPGDEISDIQAMINSIALKDWRGPLEGMKVKITDQLSRTQNGLKNGDITNVHGAEIIAKAQDLEDSIDSMASTYSGRHQHSAGGENQGGYGEDNGYSGSNDNGSEENGYGGGSGNGGGYGGGHSHHGGHHGNPVNSDMSDRAKDLEGLKDMVDADYTTSTAQAVTITASTPAMSAAPAGNTATANTR